MTDHPSISVNRWYGFSLAEQMGNIGGEVYRAIRAKQQSRYQQFQFAFERLLELLDLSIAGQRKRSERRELLRAREVLCDFLVGDNEYRSNARWLQTYFDQFALAARRQAGRA